MNLSNTTVIAAITESETSAIVFAATCLFGGLLAFSTLYNVTKIGKKTVPFASAGTMESIRAFGGSNAPWFLLKHGREAQKLGRSCYRLALPIPGGAYVVGDANIQRKILTDKTTNKSPPLFKPFNNISGTTESIFTSQTNSHWKYVRKSTAPAFSSSEVARMREIALKYTKEWCDNGKTLYGNNGSCTFDPSHEMVKLTFKIVCEAAFEYVVTDEEYHEFSENLEIALREFFLRQAANPLRGVFGFIIPDVRTAYHSCEKVQKFAARILQTYRENTNKSKQNTLIKLINSLTDISDKQKIAEIVIYLIGGHDTTAYSIASAIILLIENPDKLAKLRADTAGLKAEQWGKSSPYFNHVMKETFRLMPVGATGSMRQVGHDFDVGNDEIIPKGATVFNTQLIAHRNPALFDNADAFDPDRWYNATPEMKEAVMPFSAGSRNCVGQSLATAEIDIILPYILTKFDVLLEEKGAPDFFLTLKYANYKLRLEEM